MRTHEYYQWVTLFMVAQVNMDTFAVCTAVQSATYLLQAICFYLPGWLWSHYEKGRVADVVGEKGKKKIDDILIEDEVSLGFFFSYGRKTINF